MEQRAVKSLLGEWMAVFERAKKGWKIYSLKPLEQARKEAENPDKYRGYKQPKVPKSELTKNCPKDRLMLAREQEEERLKKEGPNEKEERAKAKAAKLAAFEQERKEASDRLAEGDKFKDRPRQRNEGKLEFFLDIDHKDKVILELAVPKFLDTSGIDIDVQPTWVAIAVKGKEFVIHLQDEVNPDSTKAERSAQTGALLLTMPLSGGVLGAVELEDRATNLDSVPSDKSLKKAPLPQSTDLTDEAIGKSNATVNLNVVEATEAEREEQRNRRLEELSESWAPRRPMRGRKMVQPVNGSAEPGVAKPNAPCVDDNPDVPPLE